jgi:DNA-binding Xre family transcriptional regulator
MLQTKLLIKALKQQLKAQGKTYADVARQLELSEASVKRLFAEQNFTLQRLEKVCQLLDLELVELVQLMANNRLAISQLSWQQEQSIVSDPLLLLLTVCFINGYSYEDIFAQYQLDSHECMQKLAILDRLKIIDLLPGNRVKLLLSADFSWIANGPIQKMFQQRIEKDFFNSSFEKGTESLIVLNGLLSDSGNAEFQQRMRHLASEFTERCRQDRSLTLESRFGTTIVMALRQWQYSLFEQYKK